MLRRLAAHLMVLADSRALLSAGSRMPINKAMIPITTKSSTSVKPPRDVRCMGLLGFSKDDCAVGASRAIYRRASEGGSVRQRPVPRRLAPPGRQQNGARRGATAAGGY